MKIFQDRTLARIPDGGYDLRFQQSRKALTYIKYWLYVNGYADEKGVLKPEFLKTVKYSETTEHPVPLQNRERTKDPNKKYVVDLYIPKEVRLDTDPFFPPTHGKVVEFHGCRWHSCDKCNPPSANEDMLCGKTMELRRHESNERDALLRERCV